MKIVLASGSERRRQMLEVLGHQVEQMIPIKDEKQHQEGQCVRELVEQNALAKVQEIRERLGSNEPYVILGADTVVHLGEKVYGKPSNGEDAIRMLTELSGQEHAVVTGFAWSVGHKELVGFVSSKVVMRTLEPQEITAYVQHGESLDKAGGYGVQGAGAALIDCVRGSLTNVIGLPLKEAFALLEEYVSP